MLKHMESTVVDSDSFTSAQNISLAPKLQKSLKDISSLQILGKTDQIWTAVLTLAAEENVDIQQLLGLLHIALRSR